MSTALIAAVAAGFLLGYTARHVRPLERIDTWAWDQNYLRSRDLRDDPTRRRRPGWWLAQTVFAVEILGALIIQPRRTAHAWRHRHDPPPPRGPAPKIDPDWAAKRRAAAEAEESR
ncbi:hypothetical protein ACFVHR_04655 [Streptomyces sp. NPDC127168]|uniref:hypothetical protein n=1 Tax=unclassified Streptomyces TaxID=2593676 RepID=UPI003635ACE3